MQKSVVVALIFGLSFPAAAEEKFSPISSKLRVSAKKGAPIIELAEAVWCTPNAKVTVESFGGVARTYESRVDYVGDFFYLNSVREIMYSACVETDRAARLTWVQSFMQARANETGMTQEEQIETARAMLDPSIVSTLERGGGDYCDKFVLGAKPNPVAAGKNRALRVGLGCETGGTDVWWADRSLNALSDIERFGWLSDLFTNTSLTNLIGLHDARTLDRETLFAALKSMGVEGIALEHVKLRYFKFRHSYKQWRAHNEKELYKDFAKLIKAYDTGFMNWQEKYEANKEAMAFALQIEEAYLSEVHGDKIRGYEGCSEKGLTYADELLSGKKAKTMEDLRKIASDPIAARILTAARECEKEVGNKLFATGFAWLLQKIPVPRGPRWSGMQAAARLAGKLREKSGSFPHTEDSLLPKYQYGFGIVYNSGSVENSAVGTVLRAKKKGKYLRIKFKKIKRKDRHYDCKSTGKVKKVRRSGRIEYEQKCGDAYSSKSSSREKPVKVLLKYAKRIKKGTVVTFSRSGDDESIGIPVDVYKSKKKKRLLNYFGFAL